MDFSKFYHPVLTESTPSLRRSPQSLQPRSIETTQDFKTQGKEIVG